ncbi:MAG: HD domain-containing protein [Clostridia bacterium]|nr:HD domain-containing protein [Clostridia bacterium]
MKRLFGFFKKHFLLLNQSIYVGEKYEKNLYAIGWFGIIGFAFGCLMSLMNILQHKGFVTYTTVVVAVIGALIFLFARVFKKRNAAVICALLLSIFVFSYYAISGANEGFAILWTLLVPMAISYFMGVRHGILLSVYFEILVIVLFYTPLRANFTEFYTETFMNRFPIIYLCILMVTTVSMTQYHESALVEIEYTNRLNAEVEKQTKVAVEQSRVATERAGQLLKLSEEMVQTLAMTIDAKDKYTNGHSFRVSEYAVKLAGRLGWSDEKLHALEREALLHDIGKIGIPDAVLNKPGKLTEEEFETIKGHTTIGKKILDGVEGMKSEADAAAYHHERYDGKGYPDGLRGEDIPEHARIISIADAFDAMRSDRVYRKGLDDDTIRRELVNGSGKQFDPKLLKVFLEMFNEGAL